MPVIKFKRPDDETLDIYLDNKSLGHYTHDSDGWEGMQRAQQLARRIAEVMNWPIKEA